MYVHREKYNFANEKFSTMSYSRYYLNSASSVDEEGSPKDYNGHGYGNEDDDNSVLWSAATGGGKPKFY